MNTPAVSVIIPTRERPGQLDACLALLRKQRFDKHFEVLIALDGPDEHSRLVAERYAEKALDVRVIEGPRHGIAEAKNRAIKEARGDLLLLINDDVLPVEHFIATHHAAQEAQESGVLVVGWSPWVVHNPDSLFARTLRETSMVFFYDRMISPEGIVLKPEGHDWGYRHAWNLNLSVERSLAEKVGGFRPALANCCYEDVEFAYRATRETGLRIPVLFEPRARADHDHVYEPEGYLKREFRLGYSAYGFAVCAPEAACAVFGRDLVSPEDLSYARAFIERESHREATLFAQFCGLSGIDANAGGPGESGRWAVDLAYSQHLLLKRLAFYKGLLKAFEGRRVEGMFHPLDGLPPTPGLESASVSRRSGMQKHREK